MRRAVDAKKKTLPKVLLLVPAGASLLAGCSSTPNPPGPDGGYCADPDCFVIQDADGGPERLPDGGYNCECGV